MREPARALLAVLLAVLSALPATARAEDDKQTITAGGRVVARAEQTRDEGAGWQGRLTLDSVRGELDYRWRFLRAVVEAELTGTARLKDAYVRARHGRAAVRAGQFRLPMSQIEMASEWELPTTSRGLLNTVLVDRMQIAGRRPGVQLEWDGTCKLRSRARLGVFRASDPSGVLLDSNVVDDYDLTETSSVVGSLALAPRRFEIGVHGELRQTRPLGLGDVNRYWSAGVDGSADLRLGRTGLRLWADLFAGSHWYSADQGERTFIAARLLAAWRLGGRRAGGFYVEPYLLASALDPDLDTGADRLGELLVGVNVGAWKRVRATLEVQLRRRSSASPGFVPVNVTDATAIADRDAVILQVGAAF